VIQRVLPFTLGFSGFGIRWFFQRIIWTWWFFSGIGGSLGTVGFGYCLSSGYWIRVLSDTKMQRYTAGNELFRPGDGSARRTSALAV
jgi:hypothetical protein